MRLLIDVSLIDTQLAEQKIEYLTKKIREEKCILIANKMLFKNFQEERECDCETNDLLCELIKKNVEKIKGYLDEINTLQKALNIKEKDCRERYFL